MRNYIFNKLKGKARCQYLFQRLHAVSLEGMNFGCGENPCFSGEREVINLLGDIDKAQVVVFDVGANSGAYAREILGVLGTKVSLYCFEPSEVTFTSLLVNLRGKDNVLAYNFGLGLREEIVPLYSNENCSGLASIFARRLNHLEIELSLTENILLKSLDDVCAEQNIMHIDLLKLDVEGNELSVLHGSQRMLTSDKVDLIQFEFGGCNIDSRTFFQDFFYLLTPTYKLYRIIQDGFAPINDYNERLEVFITTNYLAVRRGCAYDRI